MADVCEDDSRPAPVPSLPGWFETQVTLIWAVRIADMCKFSIDFLAVLHTLPWMSLVLVCCTQLFAD